MSKESDKEDREIDKIIDDFDRADLCMRHVFMGIGAGVACIMLDMGVGGIMLHARGPSIVSGIGFVAMAAGIIAGIVSYINKEQ